MKKIVLMVVLYTLFSFQALYPELSKDEKEFVSHIANGNKEEVLDFLNNKKANINKAGAKVNTRLSINDDSRNIQLENITPLMWVIFDYNAELSKLLIESGADINAKDKDGNTALDYARYRDNSEIEQLLIEKGAK